MSAAISERLILDSMPQPVLAVGLKHQVSYANFAAQEFFSASLSSLRKHTLETLMPFGSPVVNLVENCLANRLSFNEYGIDLSAPHTGPDSIVDLHVAPFENSGGEALALLIVQPRSLAHRIDKQLTHRGAARSVSAMSAMLAHEIKNPLSGIKGAAQLLESDVSAESAELTQLICSETERIAGLSTGLSSFRKHRSTWIPRLMFMRYWKMCGCLPRTDLARMYLSLKIMTRLCPMCGAIGIY